MRSDVECGIDSKSRQLCPSAAGLTEAPRADSCLGWRAYHPRGWGKEERLCALPYQKCSWQLAR